MEYVPTGQGSHWLLPSSLNCPGGQRLQLESEGAPAVFENVPVAQGTQVRKVVAPVFDENVPVGQDMQRVAWPLE
jgi:hypothetical protein